jgi:hypothetical protein
MKTAFRTERVCLKMSTMCDSTLLSRGEVKYNKNVFQQVVVYPNKSKLWQHRKVRFQSKRYRSANIKRKSKVFSCMGLKFTDVILQHKL